MMEKTKVKKREKRSNGRPAGALGLVTRELRVLARPYGEEALQVLASIMRNEEAMMNARVSACKELLDRGFGKSMQAIEMSGPDGGDIPVSSKPTQLTREQLEEVIRRA